jgi:DNA-binding transcriptional ArsR family regulator
MATWAGRPAADRDVFRAVADPTRRATLEVLSERGEQTVTALAQAVGVEMPTLSRHLAILRSAELVTEQRAGRQRIYRLRAEPLEELYTWASIFHRD